MIDPAEPVLIERRIGHLEGTVKAQSEAQTALFEAMEKSMEQRIDALDKKLDRLVDRLEKPVNWQGWIATGMSIIGALGFISYIGYIQPLEDRLSRVEKKLMLESADDE